MFDVAWSELMVVGAVALVVIGPKDLPRVMREVGKVVRQGRAMASSFRAGFDDMMRESELEEVRRSTSAQVRDVENALRAEPPPDASLPDAASDEAAPPPAAPAPDVRP